MKSLENRGILFKRTIRKITSQEGGFPNFLRQLMKPDLSLMESVLTKLAESVTVSLELTATASATDAHIHKEIGVINNIMKIVKSLKGFGLLIKIVGETVENEVKEQKGRFLDLLVGALGASLLENILAGKGVVRGGDEFIRERK